MTWLPIGETGYWASSEGLVRAPGGRLMHGFVEGGNDGRQEYLMVRLHGRKKSMHRLVAIAFHGEPPPGRPRIKHLDGNRMNGRPENLAWAAIEELRSGESGWPKGMPNERLGRPVIARRGDEEREFPSAAEAARQLGLADHGVVSRVCSGTRRHAAGWTFRWATEDRMADERRKGVRRPCVHCGGEARLFKRSLNVVRWACACGQRFTTTLAGELVVDAAKQVRDRIRQRTEAELAQRKAERQATMALAHEARRIAAEERAKRRLEEGARREAEREAARAARAQRALELAAGRSAERQARAAVRAERAAAARVERAAARAAERAIERARRRAEREERRVMVARALERMRYVRHRAEDLQTERSIEAAIAPGY